MSGKPNPNAFRSEFGDVHFFDGPSVPGRYAPYNLHFRFEDGDFEALAAQLAAHGERARKFLRLGVERHAGNYVYDLRFRAKEPNLKLLREEVSELKDGFKAAASLARRMRRMSFKCRTMLEHEARDLVLNEELRKVAGRGTGQERQDALSAVEWCVETMAPAFELLAKSASTIEAGIAPSAPGGRVKEPEARFVALLALEFERWLGREPTLTVTTNSSSYYFAVDAIIDRLRAVAEVSAFEGGLPAGTFRKGMNLYRKMLRPAVHQTSEP